MSKGSKLASASTPPTAEAETTLDPIARVGVDGVAATEPVALPTAVGMVSAVAKVIGQPRVFGKAAIDFAGEVGQIAVGTSALTREKNDWRFADPTWADNPVYRRVFQTYSALATTLEGLVDKLEESGQDAATARFTINLLISALAPTNSLLGNPAAMKRTFETGGANLVSGLRNRADDLLNNRGMPSTNDRTALQVGRDLALTTGSVVQRDEVAELIQYAPTTSQVREVPVLVVPPPIGRYYFLDLRPGRSFVQYATEQGLRTFILSWFNPGKDQSDWGLDTYCRRILAAIDAVREISGSKDVNIIGFCAGGILSSGVLNYLAAAGDRRVKTMSYAVTMMDFRQPAPIQAFAHAQLLSFARNRSRRPGVISASDMGAAFTLMRPNELIWNYWVNNYLMGEKPTVFDILSWNSDGTNLPARLHSQFLDIFQSNLLREPGGVTIMDTPVDLATIRVPAFIVGALTDHLTPWAGCYQTTQLLSGPTTFVLSNSGHVQSLVNPPGNPKASYYTGSVRTHDPDEWLEHATRKPGSWWEEWGRWVIRRSGARVAAPTSLGSSQHPPLDDAPGRYVRLPPPRQRAGHR